MSTESNADRTVVQLRFRNGDGAVERLRLAFGQPVQHQAIRWQKRALGRRRWRSSKRSTEYLRHEAEEFLIERMIDHDVELERAAAKEKLEQAARSGVVEVSVPYERESIGWQARMFPWEFVIAAATREARGDREFLVVRQLEHRRRSGRTAKRVSGGRRRPEKALLVSSLPGAIGDHYDLSDEHLMIERVAVGSRDGEPSLDLRIAQDPTVEELYGDVQDHGADLIHLAGCDTHQGAELLDRDFGGLDGYLVQDDEGDPVALTRDDLARTLVPTGARAPLLVALNVYHSAPRVCAELVATGARHAIGMQDTCDDEVAARFFTSFYESWIRGQTSVGEAFRVAWRDLRSTGAQLRGSGIVLWSAQSWFGTTRPTKRDAGESLASTSEPIRSNSGLAPEEILHCQIEPEPEVNYAMLHNGGSLFRKFKLQKVPPGRLSGIRVQVSLKVGAETFRTVRTIDALTDKDALRHLHSGADQLPIPLTWIQQGLSSHENVVTTIEVEVRVAGWNEPFVQTADAVKLLPVNEWRYREQDFQWLPSFVLPRDPEVGEVIRRAQRYLFPLFDDPDAGFAGYQYIDREADDPWAPVDWQVQAIWTSIVQDSALSYVNPPPSFQVESQRVRTPASVMNGGRGTCLDLALLLAACLEFVEIYPVVFLLEEHAFVGYWRDDSDQFRFRDPAADDPEDIDVSASSMDPDVGTSTGAGRPWVLGRREFDRVIDLVNAGEIVPLEATGLTSRAPFHVAQQEGLDNLAYERDFHSMIDVGTARDSVTPLPVWGELA